MRFRDEDAGLTALEVGSAVWALKEGHGIFCCK